MPVRENNEMLCDFVNGKIYRLKSNSWKEVGTKSPSGYLYFLLNGKSLMVHRYIYENYYCISLNQDQIINHKNHKRDDNRICNLEIVSNQQNCQYKSIPKNNTSGVKGISWHKQNKKWRAQINVNGKNTHLGLFENIEEAKVAWVTKATELNNQGHKYFIPE